MKDLFKKDGGKKGGGGGAEVKGKVGLGWGGRREERSALHCFASVLPVPA